MSILKDIFDNVSQAMAQRRLLKTIQGMSDAQALTYAKSLGLKRPKDAPGTPMFQAWRKLIVELAIAALLGQEKVCEQALAVANFIALTGRLPEHEFSDGTNNFFNSMTLQVAKHSELTADLLYKSDIAKSMQKLKGEMMELSDSKLSEFKRDLMACPITDKDFEIVQDMLAICESVQRAR